MKKTTNEKYIQIIEIETNVLEKILASSKYKRLHNEVKKELNFRKERFNSNLSVNENNHNNFNNMVNIFKGGK
jgi:D-ribose pyranose/furanose isomerase RbsD